MKFGRAAVNYYLYYINSFCDYFFDSLFDSKVQCGCRDSYASHLVTTLVQMDYHHGFQRMNPFGLFPLVSGFECDVSLSVGWIAMKFGLVINVPP